VCVCVYKFYPNIYPKKEDQASEIIMLRVKVKGKVHPCTGTEALYRPYGP